MIEHWLVVVWDGRRWDTYAPPGEHWCPFYYDLGEPLKLRDRLIKGGLEPAHVQVVPIDLPRDPR